MLPSSPTSMPSESSMLDSYLTFTLTKLSISVPPSFAALVLPYKRRRRPPQAPPASS